MQRKRRPASSRRGGAAGGPLLRVGAVVLLAASAAGCDGDGATSTSYVTRARVHGTITAADGSPAAGVRVRAVADRGGCEAELPPTHSAAGQAEGVPVDAEGRYTDLMWSPRSPFTGCVQVEVLDAAGAVLASEEGATVDFTPGPEYESVQVDVQLP